VHVVVVVAADDVAVVVGKAHDELSCGR